MTVIDGFSIDHILNRVIILVLHINQKKIPKISAETNISVNIETLSQNCVTTKLLKSLKFVKETIYYKQFKKFKDVLRKLLLRNEYHLVGNMGNSIVLDFCNPL